MKYHYLATLEKDPGGGYLASFTDVPEAIAHGRTRADAIFNSVDALFCGLLTYYERGLAMPQPAATSGAEISLPGHQALKLAVLDAFTAAEISKTELARRLEKSEGEARRILNPDHATKTPMLEAALAVLGKRLVISIEEAA